MNRIEYLQKKEETKSPIAFSVLVVKQDASHTCRRSKSKVRTKQSGNPPPGTVPAANLVGERKYIEKSSWLFRPPPPTATPPPPGQGHH